MLPKHARADVTPIRQRTQYTCMAASMSMALRAQGQTNCDEDTVNRVMGAQPMKGASWENALACAQHFGMRATLTSPCTLGQLKAWTDRGIPVLIAWNPEGREWSHASLVYDVDDMGNVWVADPNIPDPEETVRVVSKAEFYSKWFEKWPNYLVRRPAMAIEREITEGGRQVQASPNHKGSARRDSFTQPLSTRRDYGAPPMLNTESFQRILKMATDLPGPVEEYVKEVQDANPDYSESQAWATAWSIYCKYKNPGSDHCQQSPSEYFKSAARRLAGMSKKAGYTHYWEMREPFTPEEWSKLMVATRKILLKAKKAGFVIRGPMGTGSPEVKGDHIALNGDAATRESYESLWINNRQESDFCKTEKRPYDVVVVAILAAARNINPLKFLVKSDGGLDVFRNVLGSGVTAKFEKGVSMTVDEVAEVVGPEFKEMNENPPDSVVKVREEMQGKTASWRYVVGLDRRGAVTVDGFADPTLAAMIVAKVLGVPVTSIKYQENSPTVIAMDRKWTWRDLFNELASLDASIDARPNDTWIAKVSVGSIYEKEKPRSYYLASTDMFADLLKDSKFEKGKSVPVSELPDELQDNVTNPPPAVKKLTEELTGKTSTLDTFAGLLKGGKFEEGTPADPTENMSEEDAREWHRQNDANKDNFKAAGLLDMWVEDPDGYMVKFFAPTSRGSLKRQLQKTDGHWEMMQAGYALKNKLSVVSPAWISKLPFGDRAELEALMEMSPGYTASVNGKSAGGAPKEAILDYLMNEFMEEPGSAGLAQLTSMTGNPAFAREVAKQWGAIRPDIFTQHGGILQAEAVAESLIDAAAAKTRMRLASQRSAGAGLYGFNKLIEGACGAGVNKLQKAAKKIAAALYEKDSTSPSFLAKHAERGGSKTAAMLLKAMESIGPMAQLTKTAGRSGTGLYGFSEKTAKLGLAACTDLRHEAGVIAGDLFARKGADPVKVAGYLAAHAKKAKCAYAALLGECAPDVPTVVAKKTATDFLASDDDAVEGEEEVLDIVAKC